MEPANKGLHTACFEAREEERPSSSRATSSPTASRPPRPSGPTTASGAVLRARTAHKSSSLREIRTQPQASRCSTRSASTSWGGLVLSTSHDRPIVTLDDLKGAVRTALLAVDEEGRPQLSFAVTGGYQADERRPLAALCEGEMFPVSRVAVAGPRPRSRRLPDDANTDRDPAPRRGLRDPRPPDPGCRDERPRPPPIGVHSGRNHQPRRAAQGAVARAGIGGVGR